MKYIVTENHRTEYPNPIMLSQGEKVIVTDETDAEFPDWYFCKKIDGSNEGWGPKQIIKDGEVTEDYFAKELNIDKGTIVEGIKELNGWMWVKNKTNNEIGWIPVNKLDLSNGSDRCD